MMPRVFLALVLFLGSGVAYAADTPLPKNDGDKGTPITVVVTCYAPGAGGNIEGGFETSKPNREGRNIPHTLDEVRLHQSKYVTLACNPGNYNKWYNMGDVTYTSPIDQKRYTLHNVAGYCHDTGSAFRGGTCAKYNTCGVIARKFDIAVGDFRGKSNIKGIVDREPYCGNKYHLWHQAGGEILDPATTVTGGEYNPYTGPGPANTGYPANPGYPSNYLNPAQVAQPQNVGQPTSPAQPGAVQPGQYFTNPVQQQPGVINDVTQLPASGTPAPSMADRLLELLKNPASFNITNSSTSPVKIIGGDSTTLWPSDTGSTTQEESTSTQRLPVSQTFVSGDMGANQAVIQSQVQNIFQMFLGILKARLLQILQSL